MTSSSGCAATLGNSTTAAEPLIRAARSSSSTSIWCDRPAASIRWRASSCCSTDRVTESTVAPRCAARMASSPQPAFVYRNTAEKERRFGDLPAKMENTLIRNLVDYVVQVKGKTTFKEEFVTCGGIPLSEVDLQTMESRICPGLYFAGEILDVDGITGGFNFQAAWTTGWLAGKAIAAAA